MAKDKKIKEYIPRIMVDFDGVIHEYDPSIFPKMGVPKEGALEAMKRLAGIYEVVVFTARDNSNGHVDKWLQYFHIPYVRVTNIKEPALIYVDDNAYRFDNWKNTLSFIENHL